MQSSIQLRLSRAYGAQVNRVFPVLENNVRLAEVLARDLAVADRELEWLLHNLFVVEIQDNWWISNRSSSLVCSLNGLPVGPNDLRHLNAGDALEVGMLHLLVEPYQDLPTCPNEVGTAEPNTDNNAVQDDGAVEGAPSQDAPSVQSNLQALAQLSDTDGFSDPFAIIEPVAAQSGLATAPSPSSDGPSDDILTQLRYECDRALNESLATQDWSGFVVNNGRQAESAHYGEVGTETKRVDGSLHDMVMGPMHIDDVIAQLDDLNETTLFVREPSPDILRVFTPQRREGHARGPTPGLVRQDHHLMRADSHYTMPNTAALHDDHD